MFKQLKNINSTLCFFICMLYFTTIALSCSNIGYADIDIEEDPNIPLVIKNMKEAKNFYNDEDLKHDSSTNNDILLSQSISQFPENIITASDGSTSDYFGIDVAAGENVTVVGSMVLKNKPGKAYIYYDYAGTVNEKIISGSTGHAGDKFGISVDTDGIWTVVGAPDDNTRATSAGAAYLFKWNGTDWVETQKLTANDGERNNDFGFDVAIYENFLVVGDHTADKNGAAYVFKYDGFNWVQVKKLSASDGASLDYFGNAVDIYEDTIVVGAYGDDDKGKNSGSVYVFENEIENWSQESKLVPSDGDLNDNFGRNLAIEDDTIIIGAYADDDLALNSGSAYRFTKKRINFYTYQWQEEQKITASDGGRIEFFGCSVSISNKNVVIGAHFKNEIELNSGAAYLFKPVSESDASLIEITKYVAEVPQKQANLGGAVDIHDDKIIAGAVGINDNGFNSGGVYIFNNNYSDMVARINNNPNHNNTELLSASVTHHYTQQFLNNMDRIETISFKIGGKVELTYQDYATIILKDGCGNEIIRKDTLLDTTGLTSVSSWKWVNMDLDVDVEYGKFYHFELFTKWAQHRKAAKVITNTDQFINGSLIATDKTTTFPGKKRDILFKISGKANKNKKYFPRAATNIACPGRCRPVYDEKASYLSWQYFNIVAREERWHEDGSFWEDYTSEHIEGLKDDFKLMLESDQGIKNIAPYNEYFPRMNFYIAVVAPENDDYLSYKMYCANTDADIKVVDDFPFGGWAFEGGILRRTMTDENWVLGEDNSHGADFTLVHELFGHGVAYLSDEYTGMGDISPLAAPKSFNNDDIGCPRWCTAHKDVYQVESELPSACWSYDKESCKADSSCWYIGNDEMPYDVSYYFKDKTCIPRRISRHNIGLTCKGNAGCYIGVPDGSSQKVKLNAAQPSGIVMQSWHGNASEGFTTPVEDTIRMEMDCMFPLTCHNYNFELCNKFKSDWGDMFGDFVLGCEQSGDGVYYKRR